MLVERRWGHGRLRQLAQRHVVCGLSGHKFGPWWHDEGVSSRRCLRGCGEIEMQRPAWDAARDAARKDAMSRGHAS